MPSDTMMHYTLPGERERLRLALLTDQNGLLTATRQRLTRIAQARGIEPQSIEDVVQETLLEAWRSLDRLHSPHVLPAQNAQEVGAVLTSRGFQGFDLWIDEICRNVCRRAARRHQENVQRLASLAALVQSDDSSTTGENPSMLDILDSSEPDPLEFLSQQERMLLLDRALGYLSPEARQIITLCHLLELPHSEVAQRLKLSVAALDTRLHRARRQLRQIFSGPLRSEAEAFDFALDRQHADGWRATSLWCSLCGHAHLQGSFVEPYPAGSFNVHLRCPRCFEQYGIDTVHSMGLVSLIGLRTFRPAWKRTLQGLSDLITQALQPASPLAHGYLPCLFCGTPASIQVFDAQEPDAGLSLVHCSATSSDPYRFSVRWHCERCSGFVGAAGDLPSIDQIIYWSDPRARQFMAQHPRWLTSSISAQEYAGQPALCLRLVDLTSAASLTVLAQRHNLRVLAIQNS